MMLLRRWWVAAGLGLSLVLGAGNALSQTAKPRGHVVQPDNGPPPDQAVQPDPPAQYEHAGDPEQPPEPEPAAVAPPATPSPVDAPVAVEPGPPPAAQPEPAAAAPEPAGAAAIAEPAPVIVAPADNKPQSQLQKDTAALLQLAQELRAEIEKAGNNTLSVVAIRKADEIQRLSKNLSNSMKDQQQVSATK